MQFLIGGAAKSCDHNESITMSLTLPLGLEFLQGKYLVILLYSLLLLRLFSSTHVQPPAPLSCNCK